MSECVCEKMTSAEAESRLFSSPADHGDGDGDGDGACGPATTTTTGWQQMQRATDVLKLSSPQAKTRQVRLHLTENWRRVQSVTMW